MQRWAAAFHKHAWLSTAMVSSSYILDFCSGVKQAPLRSPDRVQELLQSQKCARELDGQQVRGVMHDELCLELLQQSPAA